MLTSDILVVDFVQQHDVLKLYPEAPLLSSDKAGWEGIQLQYHRHASHQLAENYSQKSFTMKRPQFIVAVAIFLITHAANLQIPLYGTYAKMAGFGSGISAIGLAGAYRKLGFPLAKLLSTLPMHQNRIELFLDNF